MRSESTAIASLVLLLGCSPGEEPAAEPVPPAPAPRGAGHRHPRLYERDTTDLLPVLVEKHGLAEPAVMHWVREQLAAIGEEALPPIRRRFEACYSRPDLAPVLVNLCETMGRIASPASAPLLVGALSHPSEGVRQKAMDALASIGVPDAVPPLATLLPLEPTEPNRRSAMRAIAAARTGEAAAVLATVFLDRGADREGIAAGQLLAAFPPEMAAGSLEEAFRAGEGEVRFTAAAGLARGKHPQALAYFAERARSPDPAERRSALRGFVEAGDVEGIVRLASDPEPVVRDAVVGALGEVFRARPSLTPIPPPWAPAPPPPPPEGAREKAIAALRARLGDPASEVRRHAERILYALGDASPAEPYLALLDSEERAARREAIAFLCDPLVRDPRALAPLLAELAKPPAPLHREIVQALGFLGDEAAAPAVGALLTRGGGVRFEDGTTLADYAAVHLANLGTRAVEEVRRLLRSEAEVAPRLRAIRTLGLMKRPDAGALLLERALDREEDREVRIAAIGAAPAIAGLPAAGPLKRALYAEGDPEIREALNCVLWDYF